MSEATTSGVPHPFDEQKEKKKGSLFGKFNARIQEAVQEGRGEEAARQAVTETPKAQSLPADDVAIRKAQTQTTQKLILPQGVVIKGTLTSSSDTQIGGKVEGDVTVEAHLSLEPTSHVAGTVHSTRARFRVGSTGTWNAPVS